MKVQKAIRLGKILENKSRALLIQVNEESIKKQILKAAPKLKNSSSWSGTYISPDLTPRERESNRLLLIELKRRKSAGEKNLIIRHGKIMQKQESNQSALHSTPMQVSHSAPTNTV